MMKQRVKFALFLLLLSLSFSYPTLAERRHKKQLPIPGKESSSQASGGSATNSNAASTGSRHPILEAPAKEGLEEESAEREEKSPVLGAQKTPRCQEKHAIETFIQISSANHPHPSHRGGVYFLSDLRETPQVFFLESAGNWPQQITFFPDGVSYFRGSPDGEKLLIATQVGGDEQYDIYLFNGITKKLSPLIVDRNKRVESVVWDAKSRWFAYTSTARNKKDMDIYRYDLDSQKSTMLLEMEGAHSVTDISPDGNKILYTSFRSVTDATVSVLNIKSKTTTALLQSGSPSYADNGKFSSNSQNVFLLSDAQHGISQAFLVALNTPNTKRPLTSSAWGVEEFILNRERNQLVLLFNEDGYSRLEGLEVDPKGARRGTFVVPKIERGVVRSLAFSPTHGPGGLFFTETSSVKTSDIWLWKHAHRAQWTRSTHALMENDCFVREKLVHYPSFDKREIPAFLYLPTDVSFEDPTPVPFIVYVHGGPEAQFRPMFSKMFQYFLERGFGVLALNIRGSTGYGKEYTILDNYKKRMDSVRDVIEGAQWLVKNRFAKPKGLAIHGGSYGGFLVLRSIQVEPELFSAACESVGITNFVTFLQNTKPYRRALREVEYGPLSDQDFLKSISPMTYIQQIKTPLLIFHGANDPRVPVNETEQIAEALKKNSIPVNLTIFPDEGHGNTKLKNIMEQAKLTVYFFEKYLKTSQSP